MRYKVQKCLMTTLLFVSVMLFFPSTTFAAPIERAVAKPAGDNIVLAATSSTDPTFSSYTADQRAAAIAGVLKEAGYNKASIGAILGNLKQENGAFKPDQLEKSKDGNKKIVVDSSFRLVKNNKKTFEGGFGIAQWTYPSRVKNLQKFADEKGEPVFSLKLQAEFLVKELKGYSYSPAKLNAYNIERATYEIWKNYERPTSSNPYTFKTANNSKSYRSRLAQAKKYQDIEASDVLLSSSSSGSGGSSGDGSAGGSSGTITGGEGWGGEAYDSPCDTTILPKTWCEEAMGGGVFEILNLILGILTAGVGIAATVGIVVLSLQYVSARDNEEQAKKARTRMVQVVIGLVVYVLMWSVLEWLMPGGII